MMHTLTSHATKTINKYVKDGWRPPSVSYLRYFRSKEPYIQWIEPYIPWKEPYIPWKEAYFQRKEPYIPHKEPHVSCQAKRPTFDEKNLHSTKRAQCLMNGAPHLILCKTKRPATHKKEMGPLCLRHDHKGYALLLDGAWLVWFGQNFT